MKVLIIQSSPQGSTKSLAAKLNIALTAYGENVEVVDLSTLSIEPCNGCGTCQEKDGVFCLHVDDGLYVANKVLESDLVIFASPVYSWYCTAEMKALLDRLVYMLNKYYGKTMAAPKDHSLWENKQVAILTTSGYKAKNGVDIFEEGFRRYCWHSRLNYRGVCAVQASDIENKGQAEINAFANFLLGGGDGIYASFETIHQKEKNKVLSIDNAVDIATSSDIMGKYPEYNKEYMRKKQAEEQAKLATDSYECIHKPIIEKGTTYKFFIPIAPTLKCKYCLSNIEMTAYYKKALILLRIVGALIMVALFVATLPELIETIIYSVVLYLIGWIILNYIMTYFIAKFATYKLSK